MKPKEKYAELTTKFGLNSVQIVECTLDIWETKLKHANLDKCNKGIDICLRTLKYWSKVLEMINNNDIQPKQ